MRPWREAMAEALYGERGFYRSTAGPAAHFRTSAHCGPAFAAAIAALVDRVDVALGHPPRLDLVDVGAGRGELLQSLAARAARGWALGPRLQLTGVEVVPRPAGLVTTIGWEPEIPPVTGVLLANEWLDVIPLDVVELTAGGLRTVLVNRAGEEATGPAAGAAAAAWVRRWWPLTRIGARAEVGLDRDVAWAGAVGRVQAGVALAVDYGHTLRAPTGPTGDVATRPDPLAGRPAYGSLTGYRLGRAIRPTPDGTCDLTAHVALDSCRVAAGEPAVLTIQRVALTRLGMDASRPPLPLAATDPAAYLDRLRDAGQAAQLLDPGGLGGFGWLLHGVGIDVPLDAATELPPQWRGPAG
ncbi:MAG: SAM-dependent methyltransferase [Geodermatophilaceae bacterium]